MLWKLIGNVKSFLDKCKRDNINAFAAQAAFFILLSSIPFLMVFSSLLQYTPVTEGMILQIVNETMPEYIAPFLVNIINEVYTKSFGIVSIAAIAAVWSAAKGVQYMANGFNVVYDIVETRNWFVLRFWAIIYTIVFVIAIVISLVLLVFGKSLEHLLVKHIPIMTHIVSLIFERGSLIMILVLVILFVVIFTLIPNRKVTFRSQLPGAVLCAIAWCVFSAGLSIYVNYFNGFSMYGSLTTLVLIMLWMYFCMYILMLCAEFNVVFDEYIAGFIQQKKERKRDKK